MFISNVYAENFNVKVDSNTNLKWVLDKNYEITTTKSSLCNHFCFTMNRKPWIIYNECYSNCLTFKTRTSICNCIVHIIVFLFNHFISFGSKIVLFVGPPWGRLWGPWNRVRTVHGDWHTGCGVVGYMASEAECTLPGVLSQSNVLIVESGTLCRTRCSSFMYYYNVYYTVMHDHKFCFFLLVLLYSSCISVRTITFKANSKVKTRNVHAACYFEKLSWKSSAVLKSICVSMPKKNHHQFYPTKLNKSFNFGCNLDGIKLVLGRCGGELYIQLRNSKISNGGTSKMAELSSVEEIIYVLFLVNVLKCLALIFSEPLRTITNYYLRLLSQSLRWDPLFVWLPLSVSSFRINYPQYGRAQYR